MSKIGVGAMVILLAGVSVSSGADFYVSPQGGDNRAGIKVMVGPTVQTLPDAGGKGIVNGRVAHGAGQADGLQ